MYGQKAQTEALVDSGATTNFIDKEYVVKHNLVTDKLPRPLEVRNADGTPNVAGRITTYIRAYVALGDHKSKMLFYVTELGNKDMMIGHTFLKQHNPEIDWRNGEWEFTRCPKSCATKARKRKRQVFVAESDELQLSTGLPWENSLDEYGSECPHNPYLNWAAHDGPSDRLQMEVIAELVTDHPHVAETHDEDLIFPEDDEDTSNWKSRVPEWLHEFGDVFSKKKSERMPARKAYDHPIDFVDDYKLPPKKNAYPMSPKERNSLDAWIDEELRKGYIRPSKSDISASFFFVKKADGSLRPCMDYRFLNAITKKNAYPIPRISDLIDALSKASIFSKIDLRWGYNNVRIREGDEWKTAFATQRGLFEATVMYFGFTNAPATFQAMMNNIFEDLIREGKVMVYLDDILVFGNDKKEHRKLVKEVLKRLRDNDLFAKAEKCFFEQDKIEYLGMVISKGHVSMDQKKVQGVIDWPVPEKVKHVQAFLGFANFYRRFIKDFAKIVRPLTNLTKKDQPWVWDTEQQTAFEALKEAFTTAPILRIPDDVNPFRLSTDASDFAIGSVLSQLDPTDNLWHPVAFHSKSLNVHERNYEIYDKEMLAIIRALEEYRHYLEGHPERFEIWSDHLNLTYFKAAQKLTRRQARWALYLTRFNYTLHHKPGKTMQAEDPLSRRPDHEEGVNLDNRDQILLKPEFFAIQAVEASHEAFVNDDQILREVKEALLSDEVTKDYHSLLKSGPREFKKSLQDWNFENGLLLYRGKVYIPKSKDDHLRRRLVQIHHDLPSAGHPGRWKTYELVSRNYWWPGMTTFVKHYVTGCDMCQRMKNRPQQPFGPLLPNKVPEGPWEVITIDLITQLTESDGFNAICVVVDRLTKRAHFYAITNQFSARDLAQLLYDKVYPLHGLPLQIISDRGVQFAAEVFQEWCKLLGIESAMSTAYHPQTDGQTERVNQILEQYLRCYVDYNLDDWSRYLSTAEFAYNNRAHEGTKETPFFLEYGRHPRAGPTLIKTTTVTDLNDIMRRRHEAQETAKAALQLAAERMKWYYDQGVQNVPFKVGDKVLLSLKDYQKTEQALHPKYEGPFEIIEQLSPVTFRLKLPPKFRAYHPVFHASKLATYNEPTIKGQSPYSKPGPITVDGDDTHYEVEELLQYDKGKYLVRWKGYGRDDDTWVPRKEIETYAPEMVKAFNKKYRIRARAIETLDGFTPALLQRDSTLQVEVVDGKLPTREHDTAAGLNLTAAIDFEIPPRSRLLVSTGIKVKLPHGTHGRIAPIRELSLNGIDVESSVIDRNWTGIIQVLLVNNSDLACTGQVGDRIAQLFVERIAICDIEQV